MGLLGRGLKGGLENEEEGKEVEEYDEEGKEVEEAKSGDILSKRGF